MSDDTEDSEASEFDYGLALEETADAVCLLANARAAIATAAMRFGANATPETDAKAATDQEEMSITEALTRARACLAEAAMMLWGIRNGMAGVLLPPGAEADLDRRLSTADRDLTGLLPIVLPPAALLVPFYAAHEGEKPATKRPTRMH
jgi:hypothetical protein